MIKNSLAAALLALVAPVLHAQQHDHHEHMQALAAGPGPVSADAEALTLHDAALVTQHGKSVSLRNDIVGDGIVVVDFVYTTCTTICPVLSAILGQVQDQLGPRLGTDVRLVSITVDPQRDTPARLLEYSKLHHAGDGWVWLTGSQDAIKQVLTDFGAYTPNFEDHPSMVLVGDARTNRWTRLLGFPSPDQIMQRVNDFGTAPSGAAHEHAAHTATHDAGTTTHSHAH